MSGLSNVAAIAAGWRPCPGSPNPKRPVARSDATAWPHRPTRSQELRVAGRFFTATCAILCLVASGAEPAPSRIRTQTDISRTLANTAFSGVAPNVETALAVHRPRSKLDANYLFLSSLGPRHLPRAWVSLNGKAFDGPRRGHAASLNLGVQNPANSRLKIGIIASVSQAELRCDDLGVSVRAAAIGPYFSRRIKSGSLLAGWLLLSRPRYRDGRSNWRATRWRGAISFERRFEPGRAELTTRGRLVTYGEDHPDLSSAPGETISSVQGNLEGKLTFRPRKDWRPYIGFDLDMDLASDRAFGRRSRTNRSMDAGLRYLQDGSKVGLRVGASSASHSPIVSADIKLRF